jgi:hypothetical protein
MPLRLLRRVLLHVEAAVAIDLIEPSGPRPGWLFFRVARSLRINRDMLVARALKNLPTDPAAAGRNPRDLGDDARVMQIVSLIESLKRKTT